MREGGFDGGRVREVGKLNSAQLKIAVIMACFNRVETTLVCLDKVHRFAGATIDHQTVDMQVFLTDANSPDNTAQRVKARFDRVRIIPADADTFWVEGMRLAWKKALEYDFDYFLWLNDDTFLYPDALEKLLAVRRAPAAQHQPLHIIVGSTREPGTQNPTYGGIRWKTAYKFKFGLELIRPTDEMQRCNMMSGNCVLVSKPVVDRIGILSKRFGSNSFGDLDYGLRASSRGVPIYLCPGYVGECAGHPPLWQDKKLSLLQRLRMLHSIRGIPFRECVVFCRRHVGWYAVFGYIKYYLVLFNLLPLELGVRPAKADAGRENGDA